MHNKYKNIILNLKSGLSIEKPFQENTSSIKDQIVFKIPLNQNCESVTKNLFFNFKNLGLSNNEKRIMTLSHRTDITNYQNIDSSKFSKQFKIALSHLNKIKLDEFTIETSEEGGILVINFLNYLNTLKYKCKIDVNLSSTPLKFIGKNTFSSFTKCKEIYANVNSFNLYILNNSWLTHYPSLTKKPKSFPWKVNYYQNLEDKSSSINTKIRKLKLVS